MAAPTFTLYAVSLATANTEYNQALPADTRSVKVKCRTAVDIRLAFVTGKVASPTDPYWTIKSGTTELIEVPPGLIGSSITVYLAGGTNTLVAEVMALS